MTRTEMRYQVLLDKLKKRAYRITPQRAAILKILIESQDHPTVEQVYARVQVKFPMTSLATVYKTLSLLKEENEVREINLSGGSRYDGYDTRPHPHLICVRCQRILDPEIKGLDALPGELAQKYGFQIINQRVDYFGICPQCQEKEERERISSASRPAAKMI